MNEINPEIIEYVIKVFKQICKGSANLTVEIAVFNGSLLVLLQDTVFYWVDLNTKIDPNISFGLTDNRFISVSGDFILNTDAYNKVIYKWNEIQSILLHSNNIFTNIDLRSDHKFEELLNLKTSDGAEFYYIHACDCNPFIPVFTGLPSISKDDRIQLSLYDLGDYKKLVNMTIETKKLKFPYHLYYKILDVNRLLKSF